MAHPRRTPPRPGRSDRLGRRAESRRLELLRAAARVFRERGVAGAGMREIAAAADVSPGILYHYFSGKDELLYFCQDRALDRMLASATEARSKKASSGDRLRVVLRAHVLCLLDDVEGSIAHLESADVPARLRERILGKRDRYERGIRSIVADGMERGAFRRFDAALVTRAILGAVNWTARWYKPGGDRSPQEVAAELADFLVSALEKPGAAPPLTNGRSVKRRASNL